MKWGLRIVLVLSALLTWITAAALYNEFGFAADPEGFKRALIGLIVIGPMASVAQTWIFVSSYRRAESKLGRRRLIAGVVLFPIIVLTIAQLTIT